MFRSPSLSPKQGSAAVAAYRADIDGLRAIAVLPIVLFHAGLDWLPGGFVGVDVFFVISGYLLGGIVLRDLAADRFSYRSFYRRRARRILPALLATLLFTQLVGFAVLLPDELEALGAAALAALLFVPNVYFWDSASTYFGLDIATQPLLHTWSLGVEEQFYLLLPLLLGGMVRWSARALLFVLCALIACSFALNVVLLSLDGRFSFYMLPTRAWELLFGVLLVRLERRLPPLPVRAALLVGTLGAILCLGAMLLLNERSAFPGYNAIYPVLGTALLLLAGRTAQGLPARVLAAQPLVAVGKLSYSLYLWHWPVCVYIVLLRPEGGAANTLLALALSCLLSWLCYRFIEQRYRRFPAGQGRAQPAPLRELRVPAAAVVLLCALVLTSAGLPVRVPQAALAAGSKPADPALHTHCEAFPQLTPQGLRCRLGDTEAPVEFALWGDSHANALAVGMHQAALESGRSGWLFFGSGCRPLLGVSRPGKTGCAQFNHAVSEAIAAQPGLSSVYLAGYWRIPYTGQGYDTALFMIEDALTERRSTAENARVFERGLRRTLDALQGRRVLLVQDVPEVGAQFGKSVSQHVVRATWLNTPLPSLEVPLPADAFEQRFEALLEELLAEYAAHDNKLEYLRLRSVLCDAATGTATEAAESEAAQAENTAGRCPLRRGSELLYHDGDHLSEAGSLRLVPLLKHSLGAGGSR